jgi:hypothetical protein
VHFAIRAVHLHNCLVPPPSSSYSHRHIHRKIITSLLSLSTNLILFPSPSGPLCVGLDSLFLLSLSTMYTHTLRPWAASLRWTSDHLSCWSALSSYCCSLLLFVHLLPL